MKFKMDVLNGAYAARSWNANLGKNNRDSPKGGALSKMAFVKKPGHCSASKVQHLELGVLKSRGKLLN